MSKLVIGLLMVRLKKVVVPGERDWLLGPLKVTVDEPLLKAVAVLFQFHPTVMEEAGRVTVQVPDGTLLPEIVRELDNRGIELTEFALRRASLDEVFLTLTGRETDNGDTTQVPELKGSPR